jgi:hypothetical protein
MRRVVAAAAVAAAAALAAAQSGPPGASAASTRCKPAGSTTVVSSSYARVYETRGRGNDEGVSYACVLRTGKRYRLDRPNAADPTFLAGRNSYPTLLTGKRLVFVLFIAAGADDAVGLRTLDLATGKLRDLGAWAEDNAELVDVYANTKAVAWTLADVQSDGGVHQVWLDGADGTRVIDRGAAIDLGSFTMAADRRRVYWMNGEEARTALLR